MELVSSVPKKLCDMYAVQARAMSQLAVSIAAGRVEAHTKCAQRCSHA